MSGCPNTSSAITACLAAISQNQIAMEQALVLTALQQIKMNLYNNKLSAWVKAKNAQDAALNAGHRLPTGWVWDNGGNAKQCNALPNQSLGPFGLCGYYPVEYQRCSAMFNAAKDSQTKAAYAVAGNNAPCNCASCAENCCRTADDATFNANVSNYQATYDAWIAANTPPIKPDTVAPPIVNNNFVCQECIQCSNISNVNTSGSPLTINQGSNQMNCLANMAMQSVPPDTVAQNAIAKKQADINARQAALDKSINTTNYVTFGGAVVCLLGAGASMMFGKKIIAGAMVVLLTLIIISYFITKNQHAATAAAITSDQDTLNAQKDVLAKKEAANLAIAQEQAKNQLANAQNAAVTVHATNVNLIKCAIVEANMQLNKYLQTLNITLNSSESIPMNSGLPLTFSDIPSIIDPNSVDCDGTCVTYDNWGGLTGVLYPRKQSTCPNNNYSTWSRGQRLASELVGKCQNLQNDIWYDHPWIADQATCNNANKCGSGGACFRWFLYLPN